MRTNSLQRSRGYRGRVLFVCAVILICLSLAFFAGPLGSVASVIVKPFNSVRSWFITADIPFVSYVRSVAYLAGENRRLTEELQSLEYDRAQLSALTEENKHLRALDAESDSRIIAGVVRRPNETPYDTLVIGEGSLRGVVEGALVYSGESVIGTIARVFPYSALVVLFSTPGIETPVYIYGPDVFAHGEGMGGGVMRIGVPQGIPIAVGNAVVIPTERSGVYGIVEYTESDPSNPEQYAFVTERPGMATLRFVAVDPQPLAALSFEDATRIIEDMKSPFAATTSLEALVDLVPMPRATTTATTSASNP